MKWDQQEAAQIVTALADHMCRYLFEETADFFQLPLLFAALWDPDKAWRQQRAVHLLQFMDLPAEQRPLHWDAFGFLTALL